MGLRMTPDSPREMRKSTRPVSEESGPMIEYVSDALLAAPFPAGADGPGILRIAEPLQVDATIEAASMPGKLLSSNRAYRLDFRRTERILKFQAAPPGLASEIPTAIENFTLAAWEEAGVQETMGYDLGAGETAQA